jgi:4-oxalmesaconate hydratase
MIGGVQAIDPATGRWFDDTKPYIDEIDWLSDEDKTKLFETNVQKVYPRMKPYLDKIAQA